MVRQEAVRVPALDLGRIRQRKRKITDRLLSLYGVTIDEDAFDQLNSIIAALFKLGTHEQRQALRQSLSPFMSQELTRRTGEQLATKIAGGFSLIKDGVPISGVLLEATWLPVMITEMRYGKVIRDKTHVRMATMIMGGALAGRELTKLVSYRLVQWVMANELAWTMHDMRPLHNELVGMWFLGYIVSSDGKLDIDEIHCLDQHVRYNRKLRKARGDPCIRHYNQRCHTCPIGYTECFLGTHRYTWIVKRCPICNREHAAFDPEKKHAKACISCQTKDIRSHWARERRG